MYFDTYEAFLRWVLVTTSKNVKMSLQEASFSQPQVGSASAVVIVLARKNLYIEDGYVEPLLRRDGDNLFENVVRNIYTEYTSPMSEVEIEAFADKQCYFASLNLMNSAAILGIDSCPIGGFEAKKIIEILNIDEKKFSISLVIALGYRADEAKKKSRHDFNDVVSFVNSQ